MKGLLLCSSFKLFSSEPSKKPPSLNAEEQHELNLLLYGDNYCSSTSSPIEQRLPLGKKAQTELFKACRIPNSKEERVDEHAILKFTLLLNTETEELLAENSKNSTLICLQQKEHKTPAHLFAERIFSIEETLKNNPDIGVWFKEGKLCEICGNRNRPKPGSNLNERLEHFLEIAEKRTAVQIASFPGFYAQTYTNMTGTTFEDIKRKLRLYANRIIKSETNSSISNSEIWAALLIKQEELLMFTSAIRDKIKENNRLSKAKIFFEENKD